MSKERVFAKLVVVLLLAVVAVAAGVTAAEDPLSTADLVRFLRAGLSERTILTELKDRGFGEPLEATREAALRAAGATETLIVAVRRAAPGAPPPSAPAATATPRPRAEGAAPPPVEGPHGLTFSAAAKSVRVPVSVLDKRGEPVLGLSGENFQITENGQKQAVTYFSGERRPLRIALCLDVSTSMTEKMKEVSEALRHFINVLEPADEIMVITFSADVHVDQDFTPDRERLERVFSKLQPDQGTALYDAVIEALRRVAPGPAESKAVVIVTDGVDTASRASFGELREIARRTEVPIFSLGIGADFGLMNIFRPRRRLARRWRSMAGRRRRPRRLARGRGRGRRPRAEPHRWARAGPRRGAVARPRGGDRGTVRDPEGPRSRPWPERPPQGGRRVDRGHAAPSLPGRLRAADPARQGRLAEDQGRGRPPVGDGSGAEGVLHGRLTLSRCFRGAGAGTWEDHLRIDLPFQDHDHSVVDGRIHAQHSERAGCAGVRRRFRPAHGQRRARLRVRRLKCGPRSWFSRRAPVEDPR